MADEELNSSEQEPKIFWSWQSDYSPKTCRHFIRKSLDEAIKEIALNNELHEAMRPCLDHDTKGERGMADITNTILNKIANAAVFVADLTPIAQSSEGKWLPNPNVMFELGWAMHRPGWERVIGVLNVAHGANVEDLPFDIRQRRIITYNLSEKVARSANITVQEKLTQELKNAINTNLDERSNEQAAQAEIVGVDANASNLSIWATVKETLEHNNSMRPSIREKIGIPDVPRAYMRVIPERWKNSPPTISDIAQMHGSNVVVAPSDACSNGDFGATEEGYVRYWITNYPEGALKQASNMTMYFGGTGEFWTLHGTVVENNQQELLIRDQAMLKHWSKLLRTAMKVFDEKGAGANRLVEAGLHGVNDAKWHAEWSIDRPLARSNEVRHFDQSNDWSDSAQIKFLTDAYNNTRNLFALDSVSESQITEILQRLDPERFSTSS